MPFFMCTAARESDNDEWLALTNRNLNFILFMVAREPIAGYFVCSIFLENKKKTVFSRSCTKQLHSISILCLSGI